jgi:hypothetical protein
VLLCAWRRALQLRDLRAQLQEQWRLNLELVEHIEGMLSGARVEGTPDAGVGPADDLNREPDSRSSKKSKTASAGGGPSGVVPMEEGTGEEGEDSSPQSDHAELQQCFQKLTDLYGQIRAAAGEFADEEN